MEDRTTIRCIAVVVCLAIVSISGCNMHTDYRISEGIAEGADPIKVSCAYTYARDNVMCTAIGMKNEQHN